VAGRVRRLRRTAGYVRQLGAGIYSLLPLGFRVQQRIEQVIRIEEQRVFGPEPRPMAMMRTEGGMAEQVTPIAPGEVEIRATVTLTAALR